MKLFVLIACLLLPAGMAWAEPVIINAVGDIMLAGSGTPAFSRKGYDYPFELTREELKRGDIAIGNLEAPIATGGREFTDKKFRFRIKPAAAPALKRAGFSIVTLANNHMMDFGDAALVETLNHLDNNGILHAGAGRNISAARQPAVVTAKGKRLAFLAFSLTLPPEFYATDSRAGTAPGYSAFYERDIKQAKASADHVIVSFHWGRENAQFPQEYQISAAHRAIDAGADVVIGHHPHVLQGIERYKNGIILYSLGNFAFGTTSTTADKSMIARILLDGSRCELEIIPLNVLNREVRFRPAIVRGEGAQAVIQHLNTLSARFGVVVREKGGRYVATFAETPSRQTSP